MALTFDWSNTDLSTESEEDRLLADSAVWLTMAVGINHITVDNVKEFFARVSFYEKVTGAYRFAMESGASTPVFFTADECIRLIGLRTNASPMTKAQFYKHVWEVHNRFNVPHSLDTAGRV